MANLITKYFDYAQLAQASYAHFTGFDRDSVIAALITENAGNFSQTQAEFFTDPATGYTLLSHQPNTLSGFSASVFQSASGEYTLAIRGTEVDLAGLISDWGMTNIADIGFNGIAISQAIDLMNYYQKLPIKDLVGEGTEIVEGEASELAPLFRDLRELTADDLDIIKTLTDKLREKKMGTNLVVDRIDLADTGQPAKLAELLIEQLIPQLWPLLPLPIKEVAMACGIEEIRNLRPKVLMVA